MATAGVKDLRASGYEHERSLDCLKLIKCRVTFPSWGGGGGGGRRLIIIVAGLEPQ